MARWEITGADRSTGDNRTFTLDAPTERDAQLAAKKRGILVAEIKKVSDGENSLASPATPVAASDGLPGYPEIVSGAGVLSAVGTIFNIAGGACLLGAVLVFAAAQKSSPEPSFATVPLAITLLIVGLMYFGVAAIIKMLGSIGLAVRDTARNSFRR